nr:hypothetical protein Iba_chr13eCG7390 [Ipomoea batatas]
MLREAEPHHHLSPLLFNVNQRSRMMANTFLWRGHAATTPFFSHPSLFVETDMAMDFRRRAATGSWTVTSTTAVGFALTSGDSTAWTTAEGSPVERSNCGSLLPVDSGGFGEAEARRGNSSDSLPLVSGHGVDVAWSAAATSFLVVLCSRNRQRVGNFIGEQSQHFRETHTSLSSTSMLTKAMRNSFYNGLVAAYEAGEATGVLHLLHGFLLGFLRLLSPALGCGKLFLQLFDFDLLLERPDLHFLDILQGPGPAEEVGRGVSQLAK